MKKINKKDFFLNKVILITGGTGSFGYTMTKRLLKIKSLKKIVLYSRDEQKHFEMEKYFNYNSRLRFFVGDIRDKSRLNLALRDVDFVINAAAMKHVPISEYNPIECIKTNIYGLQNVIESSIENNVSRVLGVSTDKAVDPINLYGATKLAGDKLLTAANNISGGLHKRFSIVRYGNVFGSKGSVLPIFLDLLNKGKKKLPITDLSMTRFSITQKEGVEFVLYSLEHMLGGETFIPKMSSLRIIDLISALIGKKNYEIIGIRPGEKLHETLCHNYNSQELIEFKKFYLLKPTINLTEKKNFKIINNENGKLKIKKFEYSSQNNRFLNLKEIKKLLRFN